MMPASRATVAASIRSLETEAPERRSPRRYSKMRKQATGKSFHSQIPCKSASSWLRGQAADRGMVRRQYNSKAIELLRTHLLTFSRPGATHSFSGVRGSLRNFGIPSTGIDTFRTTSTGETPSPPPPPSMGKLTHSRCFRFLRLLSRVRRSGKAEAGHTSVTGPRNCFKALREASRACY